MGRKKKSASSEEYLDDFDQDDNGFIDGEIDLGDAITSFSFNIASETDKTNGKQSFQLLTKEPANTNTKLLQDNATSTQKGLTPPIDGENFTVKRCYQFRPSTLRKLNELKAKNPDFNIYLNTILDTAILRYYDYIFNNKDNT